MLETYEFNALEGGRTEHRWLVRSIDRSPEGMQAFEAATSRMREFATQPWWGDQLRGPMAEDSAMYRSNEPAG